jgi:RNA polymerase sigma-70 factor, ECF subfamily
VEAIMPALPETACAGRADGVSCDDVRDVVRAHGPFIARSLRYLGVLEADLEDAAQEVFVVVHRRLGTFEGRAALSTWLYGVCTRVASARRRRAYHRYESLVPEPLEPAIAPSQEADLERQELRTRLLAVLDRLDEDKRAVFVLYEIERQPMKDVAQAVGCPLQTAYYRLHAARGEVLAACEELRKREAGA